MLPVGMTCIEITTPGGPEVLRPATRPLPQPGPGEVLIKVAAAGINRPDVLQRQGAYPAPPGASDLPGLEVAGTIAALGEGVVSPGLGQAVCALTPGGGHLAGSGLSQCELRSANSQQRPGTCCQRPVSPPGMAVDLHAPNAGRPGA